VGESLTLYNMHIKILEADETRVLLTEVTLLTAEKENAS